MIRFYIHKLKLFALLIFCLTSQTMAAAPAAEWPQHQTAITDLLHLDRFLYYRQAWLNNFAGKKSPAVWTAVARLSEPDIFSQRAKIAAKLIDPHNYDSLLADLINQRAGNPIVSARDLHWGYNFFKNKLANAFLLETDVGKIFLPGLNPDLIIPQRHASTLTLQNKFDGDILLDTQHYIANRTTRAIYWDAALHPRQFEFHLGTERAFRSRLIAAGGEVLGEIRPPARNYNKIYLVRYPGQSKLAYAFTRISGSDRLDHLIQQIQIVNPPGLKARPVRQARVFGDATHLSQNIERSLVDLLEGLPKADLVIIGQLGRIETIIRTAHLTQGLAQLIKQYPKVVRDRLNARDLNRLEQLIEQIGDAPLQDLGLLEQMDKFIKILKLDVEKYVGVTAGQEKALEIKNVSHDMTDYVLRDSSGGTRRLRVFSNVWGDEVLPIARALVKTQHKSVVSIGTAGALSHTGIKVGALAEARSVYADGKTSAIASKHFEVPGAIAVRVGHVTTPYTETEGWLRRVQDHIDAIELETKYMHSVFKGAVAYQSFLLISDIVGSKHESLATASSTGRKASLDSLLEFILKNERVNYPILNHNLVLPDYDFAQELRRLTPSRGVESRYQLGQLARFLNLQTSRQLEELAQSEPTFSEDFLDSALNQIGQAIVALQEQVRNKRSVKLFLPIDFMNGSWNPKNKLLVYFQANSAAVKEELQLIVLKVLAQDRSLDKRISVQIEVSAPLETLNFIPVVTGGSAHFLKDLYADLALQYGGLYSAVNVAGELVYKEVPEFKTNQPQVATNCKDVLLAK